MKTNRLFFAFLCALLVAVTASAQQAHLRDLGRLTARGLGLDNRTIIDYK